MITILGATASGKTSVATHLAKRIDGEIISADSRQVYRGMDIGTGKDIDEYTIDGFQIPFHMIDIIDAGCEYNVFEYQHDFLKVFDNVTSRNKMPVLCGGSGMYIESVLKGYKLIQVPVNQDLRDKLTGKSLEELTSILKTYKNVHNNSDIETKKRAIRAIEIEDYYRSHEIEDRTFPKIKSLIIGIMYDRESRRQRITQRLKQRLGNGMLDEVKGLLDRGIAPDRLIYYGLEYKFLTQYLIGETDYNEMFTKLETSIHQFGKRQMTWFRKMERDGFSIQWIDGDIPLDEKVDIICNSALSMGMAIESVR